MRIKLIKPKSLIYISLLVMIIKVSFNISNILPYNDFVDLGLSLLALALMSIVILRERYHWKKLFLYFIITAVSGISVLLTKNYGFLVSIVTCMAICQTDLERVLKFIFQYEMIFLLFHTILSLFLGLFDIGALYMINQNTIRFTFGFIHPNSLAIYTFNLLCLWVWLNYDQLNWKKVLNLFLLEVLLFVLTRTDTTMIMSFVLFLLIMISKTNWGKKINVFGARIAVPVCFLLTMGLVELYLGGNIIGTIVDELLTGRIRLGAYAKSHIDYTFLGQSIEVLERVRWDSIWQLNSFTFDNIYTCFTFNQGLIWVFLIAFSFYLLTKKGDMKECLFIILWAFYGITEVNGTNAFLFFPLLMISRLFTWKAGLHNAVE